MGNLPAGWTVFRGPAAHPIVIAHPPDWMVDISHFPAQSVIYLNGPSGEDTVEIIWGTRQTEANIDVLRNDCWRQKSEFCDKKGIEHTERRRLSGVPFAILGASCEQSNDLFYLLVASGLKEGAEWSFVMRTTHGNKDAVGRGIFAPMLASLNIYAPLP